MYNKTYKYTNEFHEYKSKCFKKKRKMNYSRVGGGGCWSKVFKICDSCFNDNILNMN